MLHVIVINGHICNKFKITEMNLAGETNTHKVKKVTSSITTANLECQEFYKIIQ